MIPRILLVGGTMPDLSAQEALEVEARVSAGHAAMFVIGREISHPSRRPEAFRFAVWGPEIFKNGWHPADQPSPCAYLPVRFGLIDRFPLEPGPFVLPRIRGSVAPEGDTWKIPVRQGLADLGLAEGEIDLCLRALR